MAGRRAPAVRLLGLAVLYFVGAAAGVALSREGGNVAAFWPPNAILLGLVLRRPDWGFGPPVAACALANLLLNLALGDPVAIAAGFAVANALEVACAYRLVAGWAGLPFDLSSLRQVAVFCGAGVLASAVGASAGAALVSHHFQAPFGAVWRTWWTADAVGMLLIAPLIVAWDGGRRLRQVMAASGCLPGLELAAALALLGAALWLVVGQNWPGSPTLFVPVLLWLALRFSVGATAAAAFAVCLAVVLATSEGAWPLPVAPDAPAAERIGVLQLYLVLTFLSPLVTAVVMAERERDRAALAASEERYRLLVDTAPDAILVHSDGRIVLANRRAAAVLGVDDPRALIGRPALAHVHPDGLAAAAARTAALRHPGARAEPAELLFRRADGSRIEVEATAAAVTLDGRPAVQALFRDITERKRLERELTEAKAHLDDALASMSDGLALFDADERLVFCNRRYLNCFPRTAHLSVPGARVAELRRAAVRLGEFAGVDERNGATWKAAQSAIFAKGGEEEYELADGRWMLAGVRRTARGSIVVVWHDITERKRLETELRLSEERHRALVEASPDAVFVHDRGRVLFANAQTARLLGAADADAVVGRDLFQLLSEEDRAVAAARSRAAVERGIVNAPWRHGLRRLDGSDVPVETTSTRLRLGNADAVLVVARDVTERHRIEQELERSRRSLEAVIATVVDGLVVIDAQGTVRTFNPAAERIFGYGAEEVVGRNVALLMPEADGAAHGSHVARFLATGERRIIGTSRTVVARRKDGSVFPLDLSLGEMATDPGLFVGVLRDITERERFERELAHRALHDPLTDLPNRALFHRELAQARARVEREGGGRRLGVFLVDLDGFKQVNDGHGHEVGDRLLVEVAARLRRCVREGDVAARLGGDEFAVIAESPDEEGLESLARRVVLRLAKPVRVGDIELRPSGSVGLAVYPDDPSDPDELVAQADHALYAAKRAGRGTWRRRQPTPGPRDGRPRAPGAPLPVQPRD